MLFPNLFLQRSLLWLTGLLLLANVPAAQGEPYLRVCKNGVIYYYFSTRGGSVSFSSKKPRLSHFANRKKVTIQELEPLINEASRSHQLPPPLVKAVIRVESNFNPGATSPKGAQGLMQLMPETASQLQVADPYDPRENVWAGVRYLRMLLDKFNYRLPLALAAYNAGPQRVDRHQEVPPIPETQGFVRDVCANFLKYTQETPDHRKIPRPDGRPGEGSSRLQP